MTAPRPIPEAQLRLVKPLIKWFAGLHSTLYKATNGKYFNTLSGSKICIVTMTGAKSGRLREFPLMYVPYGNGIVLVASLAGAPRHPVWYYNLTANPDIEVIADGRRTKLVARLASADEKAQIWPVCDEAYAEFATYRRRTTRDIPIFVCKPPAE